jgi:hypothetical protein
MEKRSKSAKSKEYYSPPPSEMYGKTSKAHGRDHPDYQPRSPPPQDYPSTEMERGRKKKSSKSDDSGGSHNGDPKKIELLQQLKVIEEAIARKRSKLN